MRVEETGVATLMTSQEGVAAWAWQLKAFARYLKPSHTRSFRPHTLVG